MADDDRPSLIDRKTALKAVRAVGPGPLEPESAAEAFRRATVEFLRKWQRTHSQLTRQSEGPTLFVFSGNSSPNALRPKAKKATAFREVIPLQIGGRLHVCNENLKEVYQEDAALKDDIDPLNFLEAEKLSGYYAVAYFPKQNALLLHEGGSDPSDVLRMEFGLNAGSVFQFDQLASYLDKFYAKFVQTHQGACDIWKNATKRILKEYAERQIQRNLAVYLELTIGNYGAVIDQEIFTQSGRSDVRVLSYVNETTWQQAIMELKVLKPSGDARQWALDGVGQLIKYRDADAQHTGDCHLCCYDARDTDNDIKDVVDASVAANVLHHRYFMKTPGVGLKP